MNIGKKNLKYEWIGRYYKNLDRLWKIKYGI